MTDTLALSHSSLERWAQNYEFQEPKEIEQFLLHHQELIPLLAEAPKPIAEVFGYVPLRLKLEHDLEEATQTLFIVISTSLSSEEALKREERLMEEWFLDRMDVAQGRLNFTEEFDGI